LTELIGWSRDGNSIYAREQEQKIVKLSLNGGKPELVATLSFASIRSITMAPDERQFVCTVLNMQSDVWLIEDFDPAAQVRTETAAASSH
jgi:hypothetical protein